MGGKKTDGREFDLEYASAVANKVSADLTSHGIVNVVCGSIRRKKPKVHDIDIVVVWGGDASAYCYEKFGIQKNGKSKRSGIIDEINVEIYPSTGVENWITNLATWTGSKEENIRLRAKAKKMGFTFSQNGFLDKDNNVVPFQTEEELYAYLGESFVEPENR
jgi:DNA polymerase/3'-5' exonuclease PolX